MSENLYALFRSRFPQDLEQPLLETPDGRELSYAALEEQAERYAAVLSEAGVAAGERVAVQVQKSPEAVVLYLACLRIGALYLPLNTAYREAELAYFLADAEPALVVCAPGREDGRGEFARHETLTLGGDGTGTLPECAAAADAGCAPPVAPVASSDPAALLYTSGTTGRSKGAVLSHANLASNALALHRAWGFRPGDVLLHALPLYHAHGLFVALHTTLLNGSSMRFLPRFELDTVLDALPHCTLMMGVPTYYTRLLGDARFDAECCRGVRLFVSGSAPLREGTFRAFEARTGRAILERYGMTETGMNASNPLDGERVPGSVGPPLPGVELRVVGGDGAALAVDAVGSLEVRGPNVFGGYWRRPELAQSEFRGDGFFVTGDLARIDARGYVHLVGRSKELVISGGLNVYPKEVERELDALPGVVESAVFGLPDEDLGESVSAAVVLEPGVKAGEAELIDGLKRRLASFKAPRRVFVVDALPRNAMGKVLKHELRALFGGSPNSPARDSS